MKKHIYSIWLVTIFLFCIFFPGLAFAGHHVIGGIMYSDMESEAGYSELSEEWLSDHQVRYIEEARTIIKGYQDVITTSETIASFLPIDAETHSVFRESSMKWGGVAMGQSISKVDSEKTYEVELHNILPDRNGTMLCWDCGYNADTGFIPQYDLQYDPERVSQTESYYYLPFDPSDVGTSSIDIYAITYDANGGDGAPDPQTKEEGKSIVLSAQIPERDGYYFVGWNTSKTASKALYERGQANTYNDDKSLELFAVWARSYTVAFNANGGTGGPNVQTKVAKAPLLLPNDVPSLEGYIFMGWDTNSKAAKAAYAAGSMYKADKDVTLYAVWKAAGKLIPLFCNEDNIRVGTAQINTLADLTAKISLESDDKKNIEKFELWQNNVSLATSKTGAFEIKNSRFMKGEPIIAALFTKDGQIITKTLRITVVSMGPINITLPFLPSVNLPMPKAEFLPDMISLEIAKDSMKTPRASYSIDNYEIRVGVGIDVEDSKKVPNVGAYDWKKHLIKESTKLKGAYEVACYFIFPFDESGVTDVIGEMIVLLKAGFTHTLETHAYLGGVTVPVVIKFGGSLSGETSIANFRYDSDRNTFVLPGVDVTVNGEINGSAGIGRSDFSVGIYGKLGARLEFGIFPNPKYKSHTLSGAIGVYVKAKVLGFIDVKKEHPIFTFGSDKDRILEEWSETPRTIDTHSHSPASRRDKNTRSAWSSGVEQSRKGVQPIVIASAGFSDVAQAKPHQETDSYTTLQQSVYDGVAPQIAKTNKTTLMAFLDNVGDATNAASIQGLVFSTWTAKGGWSIPKRVSDSDVTDADFSLYTDGKDIYAVYCEANRPFTVSDMPLVSDSQEDELKKLSSLVGTMEIVVARYDASSDGFVRIGTLTSDNFYDKSPRIAVIDGEVVVTWVRNLDNDIFGATGNNEIHIAVYSAADGTWVNHVLTAQCNPVVSFGVGTIKGQGYVAAIIDADTTLATYDDRSVILYGFDGSENGLGTGANDSLTFAKMDGSDCLLWYSDGALMVTNSLQEEPTMWLSQISGITPQYIVLQEGGVDAILYDAYNDEEEHGGRDVYAIYSRNEGNPIRLTETPGYVDDFDAFVDQGDIMIVFRRTDVEFTEETFTLSSDLCFARTSPVDRLKIEIVNLEYNPDIKADTVALFILITNKGINPIRDVNVRIDGAKKTYESRNINLMPGDSSYIEVSDYPLPPLIQEPLFIEAWPRGSDFAKSGDGYLLSLEYMDFAVQAKQWLVEERDALSIIIQNRGTIAGTATLRIKKEDATGEVLYTQMVKLPTGELEEILYELPEGSVGRICVEIAPEVEDENNYNNRVFVSLFSGQENNEEIDFSTLVNASSVSPVWIEFDKESPTAIAFELDEGGNTFEGIDKITPNNYTRTGNTVTLLDSFLATLESGVYEYIFEFATDYDKQQRSVFIHVLDNAMPE